jgi:hypothetical protein
MLLFSAVGTSAIGEKTMLKSSCDALRDALT